MRRRPFPTRTGCSLLLWCEVLGPMWLFMARRVLYAVPILLGVSFVVFLLMKMVPGDAADILIPPEAPRESAEMIRARFGLSQPILFKYLRWLHAMLRGDFGLSFLT